MTRRELAASTEWTALMHAMDDNDPGCRGDDRFIADTLTADEKAAVEAVCWRCPLLDACRNYASVEKPKAGYWAANQWRKNN